MIRWKYVLPRLALVAITWVLLQYGLPPLVRWSLVETGEASIGARVEVGRVDMSLANMRLTVRDVAVANPTKPFRNLVTADEVVLDVDVSSLLRKKYVIRTGRIRGLKFDTPRELSGALEPDEDQTLGTRPSAWSKWADRAAAASVGGLQSWLDGAAGTIEADLRREFRSPDLAEEMAAKWPVKYEQMEEQLRNLRDRGKQLKTRVSEVRDNPIRHVQELAELIEEIESLRREGLALTDKIRRLQPQITQDLRTIELAKNHDLARIQEHIEVGNLEPQAISEYLLSREVAGRIGIAIEWLSFARQLACKQKPKPEWGRGWDILFAGKKKRPDYLIRSLAIDGSGRVGGTPFTFVGTAIGLTSRPEEYGRPTILKLATSGAALVQMEATFDRTGVMPVDRLVLTCPALPLPAQTLGDPALFAIGVGPATAQLDLDLMLSGERLDGTFRLAEHQISLTAHVSDRLGGESTSAPLSAALAKVRDLRATVQLAGTLDRPTWSLESNLGEAVVAAMKDAWKHELSRRRDQLAGKLSREIDGKLGDLSRRLTERQATLLATLRSEKANLADLATSATKRIRSPVESIGRGLDGLIGR